MKDAVMAIPRLMVSDELLNSSRQFRQLLLHSGPLPGSEPVKRLGHEVVTNPRAGQSAFDSFDDRRWVAPDLIK
jgi:hypothetical protein